MINLENAPEPTYYSKVFGSFPVTKGIALTFAYGCEEGDISIGGGLYTYSGNIAYWRTVRSYPSEAEVNNHCWMTTVLNVAENGTFTVQVKCQKNN